MKSRPPRPHGVLLSIQQIATEVGASRETLRSRLTAAGLAPAYIDGRRELYRLKSALAVWFATAETDTSRMSAFQRRAFAQARHEELRLRLREGELMEAVTVEHEYARAALIFKDGLEQTLDVIERVGCDVRAIEAADRHLAGVRREIAQRLRGDEPALHHPRPAHNGRRHAVAEPELLI